MNVKNVGFQRKNMPSATEPTAGTYMQTATRPAVRRSWNPRMQ
jgi:hypothetical protein